GRDPAVMPDHDRTRPATRRIGRRELDRDRRVEPVPHDPPQPRHARDPGPTHDNTPSRLPIRPPFRGHECPQCPKIGIPTAGDKPLSSLASPPDRFSLGRKPVAVDLHPTPAADPPRPTAKVAS